MAFNPDPNELFGAGYTANSTDVIFKVADLPQLTSAEANASTGDSRKVLFAILDKVAAAIDAMPAADRPKKVRVSRSSTAPNASGQFTQTYSFSFDLAAGSVEVVNE